MTTLPENGEGIFGYKIMDRTTVSHAGSPNNRIFPHLQRRQSPVYRK